MFRLSALFVVGVALFSGGCVDRQYGENTGGAGTTAQQQQPALPTARIIIDKTSVYQVMSVLGIVGSEQSCRGGNPNSAAYKLQGLTVRKVEPFRGAYEVDLPVDVTKIGICGQATATGKSDLEIPVRLTRGGVVVIQEDKVVPTATVRIKSTNVSQPIKVIGVVGSEASCQGGNALFTKSPQPTNFSIKFPLDFVVPVLVTKIGVCGQPGPTGVDNWEVPVKLQLNQILELKQ